jgi:hypothetical protein
MLEMQDAAGRLIVILPMRMRHYGKLFVVFLEGKHNAEFHTMREAVSHARNLLENEVLEPPPSPRDGDVES